MKRLISIALITPCLLFSQTAGKLPANTAIVPYDYKGDLLGMVLSDYKSKYDRALPPSGGTISRAPHILDYDNPTPVPTSKYITPEMQKKLEKDREHRNAQFHGWIESTPDMRYEWLRGSRPIPTLAGVPVNDLSYWFFKTSPEPKLGKILITFPSTSFITIKLAMTEKWGNPKKIEFETLQNKMGAKFNSEVVIWSNGISEIQLVQYNNDLKYGIVKYLHLEIIDFSLAKAKETIKTLSSDM